jgi:MFS transporter, PHS family, inorganic phosphate transporter
MVVRLYEYVVDSFTNQKLPVWRICVGVSLLPAFATLYQRLTLPESTRFKASQKDEEENGSIKLKKTEASTFIDQSLDTANVSPAGSRHALEQHVKKKAHIKGKDIVSYSVSATYNCYDRIY